MNQVEVLFLLGISWLAVYAKSRWLYASVAAILGLWGYQLSTSLWLYSAAVFILAAWMVVKAGWPRL
jgi:hypothetical protein